MNTKKRLVNAMRILIEKYPIKNITVDMILQESDVSKTTFYRYYDDKYALMSDYYQSSFEKILQSESGDFINTLRKFVLFIKDNAEYFRQFTLLKESDNFYNNFIKYSFPNSLKFMENLKGEPLNTKEKELLTFYLGGIWTYLNEWILIECKKEIDEVAEIIYLCMPVGLAEKKDQLPGF